MILNCPQCSARFLLAAHVLAPSGRRVKCSGCGHLWFQEPDPGELRRDPGADILDIPEGVKPIPEGSSVPALPRTPERPASPPGHAAGFTAAAGVFIAAFAVLLLLHGPVARVWPASAPFYQWIGMGRLPGEGLVFDHLKASAAAEGPDREIYALEGRIINLTRKSQSVPAIEVRLLSEGGQILGRRLISPPAAMLAGEASIPIKIEYAPDKIPEAPPRDIQVRFVLEEK